MKRYYYIRDRRIDVEEIPDIAAVLVATDDQGKPKATTRSFGTSAASTLQAETEEIMSEETAEAFAKAHWLFVKPSRELCRAMASGERVDNAEEVGKLIRRQDGSVGIATNRLNVQLKPEYTAEECAEILAEKQLDVLIRLKFAPNLYEVNAQRYADTLEASVELHDDPRFILAEPSFVEHIPLRYTPTDPDYTEQWQWNNTGANGGTAGADVSAEAAWDHTLGAGIRVAVIDNGFDADHEDLSAGVVGDSGYFQSGGGGAATFQQGTAGMPGSSHGTFCAGMVGARHNNGNGGCGAAPECELMLIACLVDQVGTQTTLARAVAYATDPSNEVAGADPADGADILVSSLGPNGAVWNLTGTLELALENAAANARNGRGLAIFWAASNGNNVDVTQDEVVSHDDVIAVVRSNRNDQEDNTARGNTVEIIAPGVDVYNTRPNDTYGTGTGTSYAAPCTAGCAALALSTNPDLTRDELRQIMRDTADQIGGVVYDANGHNDDYGFGRVNAEQAVQRARSPQMVVGNFGYNAGGWRVDRHPRFLADLTGDGSADIVGFGNAGVWFWSA
ncbi:MAG: S8 family serine peptidase [Deltaproteobacteria bacterium]|jgi:thermitase|nr:S8 family serine peptidase [Deltaproteobacteria bacterium]